MGFDAHLGPRVPARRQHHLDIRPPHRVVGELGGFFGRVGDRAVGGVFHLFGDSAQIVLERPGHQHIGMGFQLGFSNRKDFPLFVSAE